MNHLKSILALTVVLSFIFCSCKKENIDPSACSKGCATVQLSGKLIDVYTNAGFKNTEVKANFSQWKSTCFYCFGEPVETSAKTITDDLGRFNFSIIVDTGVFKQGYHYSLSVYTNANDNYISGNYKSFDDYHSDFSNIVLTKYKKTKLKIQFKRDYSDPFYYYTVNHTFLDNINGIKIEPTDLSLIFQKLYSPIISDTTIEVFTGANFWTKINGRKALTSSTTSIISYQVDSIYCNPNTVNNIVVKY